MATSHNVLPVFGQSSLRPARRPASLRSHGGAPTYVRVVVTARCPLACSYCHREGDPAAPGREPGLATGDWIQLLHVAVDAGARKIKFLGGEPLIRTDLPEIVSALRARDATLDLSVVTSGAVPADRLDRLYVAGLSRANVSMHGFGAQAFAERTGSGEAQRRLRDTFLARAIAHGRPLKTNYVYRGARDDDDLAAFLAFAAERSLLVAVLDDLRQPDLDAAAIEAVVVGMRGAPTRRATEPDPHSLPTLRLHWDDGLVVELKNHRLGEVAPWETCAACPVRARCREGIHALRLTHTGELRPCMDRPDLSVPLFDLLHAHGVEAARDAWSSFATARSS